MTKDSKEEVFSIVRISRSATNSSTYSNANNNSLLIIFILFSIVQTFNFCHAHCYILLSILLTTIHTIFDTQSTATLLPFVPYSVAGRCCHRIVATATNAMNHAYVSTIEKFIAQKNEKRNKKKKKHMGIQNAHITYRERKKLVLVNAFIYLHRATVAAREKNYQTLPNGRVK